MFILKQLGLSLHGFWAWLFEMRLSLHVEQPILSKKIIIIIIIIFSDYQISK